MTGLKKEQPRPAAKFRGREGGSEGDQHTAILERNETRAGEDE
jgi:hypothetical protein